MFIVIDLKIEFILFFFNNHFHRLAIFYWFIYLYLSLVFCTWLFWNHYEHFVWGQLSAPLLFYTLWTIETIKLSSSKKVKCLKKASHLCKQSKSVSNQSTLSYRDVIAKVFEEEEKGLWNFFQRTWLKSWKKLKKLFTWLIEN